MLVLFSRSEPPTTLETELELELWEALRREALSAAQLQAHGRCLLGDQPQTSRTKQQDQQHHIDKIRLRLERQNTELERLKRTHAGI
jgi:hypothetical protein